jgi:L-ascorbate metabolism protein UlaG (beta-lactamase superfamily)
MKQSYLFPLIILLSSINPLLAQKPTPETFETTAGTMHIYPILHATMVIEWNGKTIYMDPYGGAERFEAFAKPDLVVITHAHGDHLNAQTLEGLNLEEAELIAPQSVVDKLGEISFAKASVLANGESLERFAATVLAVPMYNLPDDETSRHKPGWGNGYVLTLGGQRIYISGDTEDIEEMRDLEGIDIAFVCMNLPYTMDVEAAADAVVDFAPGIVYPFHYRGGGGKFSDVEAFKQMVNQEAPDVEVRLRNWYPEK